MTIYYRQALGMLIIFLFLVLVGCRRNLQTPVEIQEVADCYKETDWNANDVHDALIGKWELQFGGLYSTDVPTPPDEQNGKFVEFNSDSLFVYDDEWTLIDSSHWEVVVGDAPLFELELTKYISGLRGRILICDDVVIFNNSYISGTDSFFQRFE